MRTVTYYASHLSPKILEDPDTGFIICLNVPIARSGFQEYLGRELMKHRDYKPEWGLNPDESYKVYRPREEVTSAATLASFEGKPVADEHPPEYLAPGSLFNLDNATELQRGHVQRVHIGDKTEDGEVTLAADVHLTNLDLVKKVVDQRIRNISCGYTYRLNRAANGTFYMSDIRGNHVAVVERGRAGPEIAIGDSAPDAQRELFHASLDLVEAMCKHLEERNASEHTIDGYVRSMVQVPSPVQFFNGVPHSEGLRRWNEHLAAANSGNGTDAKAMLKSPTEFFNGVPHAEGMRRWKAYLNAAQQ